MDEPVAAPPSDDVTVVIPFRRGGNTDWLEQAQMGFTPGQKLLIVENDGEMAEALNDAISNHVETPWVYRFDADDVAGPLLVQQLRDAVWDGADGAYPSMVLAAEDLKPTGLFHADPFCSRRLALGNYVTGAALFRQQTFVEVGGYRHLPALEDWDLWLRMVRETGARFKPVPEAFFFYRQVGGSRNKLTAKLMQRLADEITGDDLQEDAIATFYYGGTPMSAHLRCVSPGKYMPAISNPVYHIPSSEHEEQPAIRFPNHRGAAILQFASTQMDSLTFRWMQLNGHPLFIEVDDNYTVSGIRAAKRAGWQPNVLTKNAKGDTIMEDQRPSTEGHLRIVRSADGVICSTPYLAEVYREFNDNVWVCPNQVEPSEWPEPLVRPEGDTSIRVGWFASPSHEHDFPMIRKALIWASKRPGVRVMVMGIEVNDSEIDHVQIPWHDDWGIYRLALGGLDIGLAPIAATPWSLGRSDLKALDYAMGNACPILQDEQPYEEWVAGETCLKARTPDDWLRMLKYAVYNEERRREIAQAAREYTLAERTFEKNAWRWRKAIKSATRTAIAA